MPDRAAPIHRVDLRAAEVLAEIAGELSPAEAGVYFMICLLALNRGGSIPDDPDWLRGKFRRTPGLRNLKADLERLISTSRVCRADNQLSVSWCRASVEHASSLYRASVEHGSRGGRPARKNKKLQKPSGSSEKKPPTPTPTPTPTLFSSSVSHETSDARAFDDLWRIYPSRSPHRSPKQPAKVLFERLVKRGVPADKIISAAASFAGGVRDAGTTARYIPQLRTWLNQEGFLDEAVAASLPHKRLAVQHHLGEPGDRLIAEFKVFPPWAGSIVVERASPLVISVPTAFERTLLKNQYEIAICRAWRVDEVDIIVRTTTAQRATG